MPGAVERRDSVLGEDLKKLGWKVWSKFDQELSSEERKTRYDPDVDADSVQLEMEDGRFERLEITVQRYGDEIYLKRLFRDHRGEEWQEEDECLVRCSREDGSVALVEGEKLFLDNLREAVERWLVADDWADVPAEEEY